MLIGELAHATETTTKTLRYYESEGLLAAPQRTAGGYRDYPHAAIERVLFIRHAQASGLTLDQIGQVLDVRDGGVAPCAHVSMFVEQRVGAIDARIRDLQHTRRQLVDLRRRLRDLDPAQCDAGAVCSAIGVAPR
jgi:DNA-binding transcriptional MerR regulator